MKKRLIIALAALLLLSACAVSSPASPSAQQTSPSQSSPLPASPSPSPHEVSVEPSPEGDRLAEILGPDITPAFFDRVDGSTATIPLSEAVAQSLLGVSPEEAVTYILHNKTHSAYMNLIEGRKDIIFVTYPSEDELEAAGDNRVELEVVELVKDAFVFLVNSENPVESLTQKQLRDIYTGKTVNWKAVGGKNAEVVAYQRPDNSGSQTLMYKYLLSADEIMDAPTERKIAEMSGLVDVVAAYDNAQAAIGYSVFYYANDMYLRDQTRLLGVDGVIPSKETLKDGSYPFLSYYYAVLRKSSPEDSPERRLLNWLLSPEGQALAEEAGYVALQ